MSCTVIGADLELIQISRQHLKSYRIRRSRHDLLGTRIYHRLLWTGNFPRAGLVLSRQVRIRGRLSRTSLPSTQVVFPNSIRRPVGDFVIQLQ